MGCLDGCGWGGSEHGCLLVFDEALSGFRVAWGSMQSIVGVTPDITCLGKVIGGGMPVAAYAARRELMDLVSPLGPVYQAGTLSGNPLGMAAGLATLTLCRADGFYEYLAAKSRRLIEGVAEAASGAGVSVQTGATGGGQRSWVAVGRGRHASETRARGWAGAGRVCRGRWSRGVGLPPAGYEAMCRSSAHTDEDGSRVIETAAESFREIAS